MWITILGIVSGALVYGAMAVKNLVWIRALLLLGAVGFLSYGIILALPAIIIVNAVGVLIGIFMLIRALKARKKA